MLSHRKKSAELPRRKESFPSSLELHNVMPLGNSGLLPPLLEPNSKFIFLCVLCDTVKQEKCRWMASQNITQRTPVLMFEKNPPSGPRLPWEHHVPDPHVPGHQTTETTPCTVKYLPPTHTVDVITEFLGIKHYFHACLMLHCLFYS